MGNSQSEPVRPSNEPQQRVRRPRLLHHEIKMFSEELESLCHSLRKLSSSLELLPPHNIRMLSEELESKCHQIRRLSEELESLCHILRPWLFFERQRFLLHPSDEESDSEEDRESRVRRPRLLHHDIRMLSEELESKCHQVRRLSEELESLCHSLRKLSSSLEFLPPHMADEDPNREEDRESLEAPSLPVPEVRTSTRSKKLSSSLELLPPHKIRRLSEELESLCHIEAPSLPVPEVRTSTSRMNHARSQRNQTSSKIRRLSVELESLCHSLKKLSSSLELLPPHRSKKLSSSLELLPPHMSELRVVLLGNSWSERCSVGNFILGETKFNTEEEPDHCLRVSGERNTKQIIVINTTDHFMFHIRRCLELFDPGPHVFLLTLQPEDFTEEQKQRLCRDLQRFSEQSFDHSLILISTPRDESSGFMERYRQQPPLKDMIKKCKYRFLWRKDLDLPELLTRLGQVVKENNGQHVMPWWL